ncbi:efflux RND transporter permease subunit [Chelatococcus reniformis]|uniref:Acriflavine resistance protein B n=1 Tax=Chelatococcus reniformis TaxID=1494448 RepID=A0A916U5G9_9HYPH|nr:efflux RND transporter permease subunit [Chelatococcus reniformis]GGC61364.1 acriflavine resistance protein B [Chelatococcus reniformis]
MNISAPFIRRPVGTTLLAVGLFLLGAVAYAFLPVASLPAIEFPTVRVIASRPGADPATMAATVAAPLERSLASMAGVNELTSSSSLGSTVISVQFDLSRPVDAAARDVQAALNAAAIDLPSDLPILPTFRKANSAAMPVLILALTSDTMPPSAIYDAADTVLLQRVSQVEGVADVTVAGAEQPSIRVNVDPQRLAAMGIALADVRNAIVTANTVSPLGTLDGASKGLTIAANNQMTEPEEFGRLVVRAANGTIVQLKDIATIERGVRNTRAAGWYNGKPAVLITVTKQPDANVIETVDRVKALLPELKAWIPAGIDVAIMSDRTMTIRASVDDIQKTLLITIALVMMVVFLFLRRLTPTLAAGVTVPLSLAGTFAAMWAVGFTLDNLSLMAITISVGFVVDDAIVMIENIHSHMERGLDRFSAALAGAREIGFTVISISLSLIAAFVPLLFMGGLGGLLFREFSLTLTFAVITSTLVSLTVTPMICAHFMKPDSGPPRSLVGRLFEGAMAWVIAAYGRSLHVVLRHPWFMLIVLVGTVALTVQMFKDIPKGTFPQDDTGLIFGFTNASADVSFPQMAALQQQAADIVAADPAVQGTASFIGGGMGSVNQGRLFVSLKPEAERRLTSAQVVARLRREVSKLPGLAVYLTPVQDLRTGARAGKSAYQFTLWSSSLDDLDTWTPQVLARLRKVPELVDVSTDREQGGLQANLVIDRQAAARVGVAMKDVDNALAAAFAQSQVSTIYGQKNQYSVIMGITPSRQRDPEDLTGIYVSGSGNRQIPLASIARVERTTQPLVVNHQGVFPSITINYANAPAVPLESANAALRRAIDGLHLPDGIHADFAGDAKALAQEGANQIVLLLSALLAIYIILGVLYESLLHPITIISTLPPAGLGALLALRAANTELTIIAFIGIILLIGIVKKNGIMLVDFAIMAERRRGLSAHDAIFEACLARFRPILMTTMAAILGAVPLAVAIGAGAEMRRPLGITIVGGLVLSQVLTLYSTPVIYLLMSKLQRKKTVPRRLAPAVVPAE